MTAAIGDFGRVDLLRRWKNEAGVADASELSDTDDIYPFLSDGQIETARYLSLRAWEAFAQAATAMTSTDGGLTFTYGASPIDATKKLVPLGKVQIARTLSAFTGASFAGLKENVDYLPEGDRIRMPGNRAYSGTLYARFVPTPPPINATTDAILRPPEINLLTVYKAVELYADQGNTNPALADRMALKFAKAAPSWVHTFKASHRNGSGMADPALWYRNVNLGSGSGFSA